MHTDNRKAATTGRRFRTRTAVLAGAIALSVGGCMSLDVTDPNNLSIATVFNNAANAEAAIVGSWKAYTEPGRNICGAGPGMALDVYALVITSNLSSMLEFSQEPRRPIDNQTQNSHCILRTVMGTYYEAAAGAREAFIGIKQNNLIFGAQSTQFPLGRDHDSRKIFARFIIAASTLKHGLLLDKAYITDTITPGYNQVVDSLSPWPEVVASAKAQLYAAIAEARKAADFTLPVNFVNGRAVTRDELVRVMYSMLVRADVYSARTPQQRAAVNWAAVLARLDSGITTSFGHMSDNAIAGTTSPYLRSSYNNADSRLSMRYVGPADTSNAYQNWLNTPLASRAAAQIRTPDRRISATSAITPIPITGIARIQLTTGNLGSLTNAPYNNSFYRHVRYLNATADSATVKAAFIPMITVEEMRMVRAEALIRLGRNTEAAALINQTRVPAGLLPVDANGAPPIANGRGCVPRRDDGSCGTLFDAMMYEKRMEAYPSEFDLAYLDARGWGRLLPGTPLHFPILFRELETKKLPYYTFGGTEDTQNSAQLPNAHRP